MTRPAGLGLLGALLLVAACGDGDDSTAVPAGDDGDTPGAALAGRTFVSTGDVAIPGGGPLEFRFTDDGRLLATAGCNTMNGPVDLTGGRLTGDDLPLTEMGCQPDVMESDRWLTDLIAAEPAWELSADDTLVITTDDQTVTLIDSDTAEQPAPPGG